MEKSGRIQNNIRVSKMEEILGEAILEETIRKGKEDSIKKIFNLVIP